MPQTQIKIEPGAVDDSNLIDEPILSAEISNISLEDYSITDEIKTKVDFDNGNKSSLTRAKTNTTKSTSVKSKNGEKKKNKGYSDGG